MSHVTWLISAWHRSVAEYPISVEKTWVIASHDSRHVTKPVSRDFCVTLIISTSHSFLCDTYHFCASHDSRHVTKPETHHFCVTLIISVWHSFLCDTHHFYVTFISMRHMIPVTWQTRYLMISLWHSSFLFHIHFCVMLIISVSHSSQNGNPTPRVHSGKQLFLISDCGFGSGSLFWSFCVMTETMWRSQPPKNALIALFSAEVRPMCSENPWTFLASTNQDVPCTKVTWREPCGA